MKVKVHHNGDDVFIAWKPKGFIPTAVALRYCADAMGSKKL